MRILLTCLFVISMSPLASAQTSAGGPILHVDSDTWNLGARPQNKEYKHAFKIENRGDKDLVIRQVVPSCNCAAGLPKKRKLAPGEKTEIEVTMKTLQFKGQIHKVVTVISNCSRQPQLRLNVSVEVLPPYYVKPAHLMFGKFSKSEESKEIPFVVVKTPQMALEIKDVVATSDRLEITKGEVENRADGSVAHHYKAKVKKGARVGLLRETVTVITDYKQQLRTAITATGDVAGEVMLSLQNLNFGACKAGSGKTKELIVTKTGAPDLAVTGVVVRPEGKFDAKVETLEEGRKYKVTVTLKDTAKPGYVKGSVNIKTNCPGEEVVRAWFHAFVTK